MAKMDEILYKAYSNWDDAEALSRAGKVLLIERGDFSVSNKTQT